MADLRKQVLRYRVERDLAAAGRSPRHEIKFTSQFGEDLLLWHLFEGKLDGFFIEVGAYDGVTDSVSYPFEAVGWNGLLIEAIPARAQQCRAHRLSRVVHSAVSRRGSTGTAMFTVVQDDRWDRSSFLGNNLPAGSPKEVGAFKRTQVEVPLTSMDELLKDHTGPIEFAVLDVEGEELNLLDGFDLARFRPAVLLIEENSGGKDDRLPRYMASQPYRGFGWIGMNQIYIHKDRPELADRLTSFTL